MLLQIGYLGFFMALIINAFHAILFLQSGLDKVFHFSENESWLQGHFKDSPLSGKVNLLLGILTILEVATGIAATIGVVTLLLNHNRDWTLYASLGSAVCLLCLFLGQRLAKDYAGAQSLVSYLLVALAGVASAFI